MSILTKVKRILNRQKREGETGKEQSHQPSLDDVFLAKTGRSLEGAGEEEEDEPEAELAVESA